MFLVFIQLLNPSFISWKKSPVLLGYTYLYSFIVFRILLVCICFVLLSPPPWLGIFMIDCLLEYFDFIWFTLIGIHCLGFDIFQEVHSTMIPYVCALGFLYLRLSCWLNSHSPQLPSSFSWIVTVCKGNWFFSRGWDLLISVLVVG